MNGHSTHPARRLAAVLGTGLLALSLAACGGPSDESAATPTATDQAATDPPTSGQPTATVGADATETSSPSATDTAGSASEVEAALVTVLGEEARVVTGERVRELTDSAQGLTGQMTVTPADCGQDALGGKSGELPEGTELTGAFVVEATDPAAPSTDVLGVTDFPDTQAAADAVAGYAELAAACPAYTVELDEGMAAEVAVETTDVDTDADTALAMEIGTSVSIEGVELPEGADSTTSTTLYVQDGERLISYAGTRAGGESVPVADGLAVVDALRAELDG